MQWSSAKCPILMHGTITGQTSKLVGITTIKLIVINHEDRVIAPSLGCVLT